ncbi:MAG: succinate dehydrogenase cytochrome b subunit [Bacteriovoracaceae bacterium]
MSWIGKYAKSSIGKKQMMAVSGLLLCGFLVAHLAGNLLLLCKPEVFNEYSHKLVNNPFIVPMEIGLVLLFVFHLAMGILLNIENSRARPDKYAMKARTGRGATFASANMIYTGIIIFIFLIIHLKTFKYGTQYIATYSNVEMRDLYRTVMECFQSFPYTLWYVFAMLCLGIHLSHGFASTFKSLGLEHEKYTCTIERLGKIYAIVVAGAFAFLAAWSYFKGGV